MFPKLSDLVNYVLGTHISLPFQTYGFMLAVAFIAGGLVLRSELKRKEKEGLLVASGEKPMHPYEHTWSILVVALVAAIVGSKLFDILDNFESFLKNPVHSLFSLNGFAFNGGLILTVIALIFYMRVIRLDWKHVIDCTAPGILVGYALGRLGCHLSGDGCWGIPNPIPLPQWLSWLPGWAWACHYPHNVINAGILIPGCGGTHCFALAEPVFPTSLYECALAMIAFGILWAIRKRIKAPVVLFGLFLILYGTERLFIEQIRVNHKYHVLGMQASQAEIISVLLILTGAAAMAWFHHRHQRRKTPSESNY